MQPMFKYILFGMYFCQFCFLQQSVFGLQLSPSVRSIEAFAGNPFEINCDEEALAEGNKDLIIEWINPQGEIIGSSRDVPKPPANMTNNKHRVGRLLEKFKDLARNVMLIMKAYAALVIENKQNSGVYRCVLRDVSFEHFRKFEK